METLWILGLCKAVALPAICAVLKCIAKQKGHSLPRWGQLLRGVFLSQIIVLTVVGTLHVYEPAFWILVAAAGSWFATIWILDQCSFGIRESSQREMSNQHSQDAQQTDHSQPPVVVNQVYI
jgi:quinol-cytochrome oxidoreductase complex cytochrome b subunit